MDFYEEIDKGIGYFKEQIDEKDEQIALAMGALAAWKKITPVSLPEDIQVSIKKEYWNYRVGFWVVRVLQIVSATIITWLLD